MSLINFLGRWVGEIRFFSGKILGLMVGYPSKTNFQNYMESLPEDFTLWQIWAPSMRMGGNGISGGEEISLITRWG